MRKSYIIYIVIIAIFILLATMLEKATPKRQNWTPRFSTKGTFPFDLQVFSEQVNKMPKWKKVSTFEQTFYELYNADSFNKNDTNNLLLFIGDRFELDKESQENLLDFVAKGNDVFVSTNTVWGNTFDSFDVFINKNYDVNLKDSTLLQLNFSDKKYLINKKGGDNFISTNGDITYSELGSAKRKDDNTQEVNFIKIKHGKGTIFIHAAPIVFTNYYMLNGNLNEYVSYLMGYSNKTNLLYQTRDLTHEKNIGDSRHPLRFILSQPALKWAWLIGLSGLILFMIFTAKRRQRIVPIIKPLENTTVAYTQTIADLFYDIKDHNFIAQKRIIYFLEYLRSKYYINTQELDNAFVKQLTAKSGIDKSYIEPLIEKINFIQKSNFVSEQELIQLDKLISTFKHQEQTLYN